MRAFEMGENPNDVVSKIDRFIQDSDNTDSVMKHIGDIMNSSDKLERVIGNIEDDHYRNEMLGYITMIRQYVTNTLDAFDSMMDV